jgi:hypothetical protein
MKTRKTKKDYEYQKNRGYLKISQKITKVQEILKNITKYQIKPNTTEVQEIHHATHKTNENQENDTRPLNTK